MGSEAENQEPDDGLELVNLALKGGMITQAQWLDAFAEKTADIKSGGTARRLTQILLAKGYLTEDQLADLRKKKAEGWVVPVEDPRELTETPIGLAPIEKPVQQRKFGKYAIENQVTVDARMRVYEAVDTSLNRSVSLRLIRTAAKSDTETERRHDASFSKEPEFDPRLSDHPNVLRVYEAGFMEGRRYIAVERAQGVPMNEWLEGRVSLREKVTVLRDVARAVQHAHDLGIIHRDLRPKNVIVDGSNQAKVADFGIARLCQRDKNEFLFRSALSTETVVYLSPEQAENPSFADRKTDIYALGVMLYEIIAGASPHRGKTAVETLMKKSQERVAPPTRRSTGPSGADRELEKICMKALSRKPAGRIATAGAFADALDAWLKGEQIKLGGGCLLKGGGAAAALAAAVALGVVLCSAPPSSGSDPAAPRKGHPCLNGEPSPKPGRTAR